MNHKTYRRMLLITSLALAALVKITLSAAELPADLNLTAGGYVNRAIENAVPAEKMAPDLTNMLRSDSVGKEYAVIVQTQGSPAALLNRLVRASAIREEKVFSSINGFACKVSGDGLSRLAADEAVIRISPDRTIQPTNDLTRHTTGVTAINNPATKDDFTWPAGRIQGPEDTDWFYDEHVDGVKGTGVRVAVLDSGVHRSHRDIMNRVIVDYDFTTGRIRPGKEDHYGHGTHVAGTILGSGDQAKRDRYRIFPAGMAPGAQLVCLRVLDNEGNGSVSNVILAIDFLIRYNRNLNVKVMNLSLGHPVFESYTTDPFCQAVEAAVQAGIVVVCSAGNLGQYEGMPVYGGITTPGNDPLVITVGASDSEGTPYRSDDSIAPFSSKGPTLVDGLLKPDLVAPGHLLISPKANGCYIEQNYPHLIVPPEEFTEEPNAEPEYLYLSGTSMAAPAITGIVALMFEVNGSLSPNLVKAVLMYTAERMVEPNILEQGCGLVNAEGAVRLAALVHPAFKSLEIGDEILTIDPLTPWSFICEEQIKWGVSFVWGDDLIWGDGILWADRSIWGSGMDWIEGIIWDEGILWADRGMQGNCYLFWEETFWSDPVPLPDGVEYRTPDVVMMTEYLWDDRLIDPESVDCPPEEVLAYGNEAEIKYVEFVDRYSRYYPRQ
jgi:serine protease AprX